MADGAVNIAAGNPQGRRADDARSASGIGSSLRGAGYVGEWRGYAVGVERKVLVNTDWLALTLSHRAHLSAMVKDKRIRPNEADDVPHWTELLLSFEFEEEE